MRLTCPKCSAQYEVPDEVIPEEGRDVQCSNCEETWFQAKYPEPQAEAAPAQDESVEETENEEVAAEAPAPEAEPEPAPAEEAQPPKESSGNVDPAVANILQQEAAREAELRAQEGSGLESQPDLALDPPAEEPEVEAKEPTTTETAEDAGHKDVLPDVEAINSSLRSDETDNPSAETEVAPRKSSGFVRGFVLILVIGVILFLIYGNASQISEAVPQAEPALQSYVSLVDQARIWLETQAGSASQ